MVCAGCKNLDEKKKVNGAVSGTKYYCKKNKNYVDGSSDICSKFVKGYRDTDTYNKIYREGREWDDDKHSVSFYIAVAIILLIVLLIAFLCNPDLY